MAEQPSADDLLRRAILAMMRDPTGNTWPRASEFEFDPGTADATETHLEKCPDAQVADVDSGTDATSTGTQVGRVTCTVHCPHGFTAQAQVGAYGHVSFLLERMEEAARRLTEEVDG